MAELYVHLLQQDPAMVFGSLGLLLGLVYRYRLPFVRYVDERFLEPLKYKHIYDGKPPTFNEVLRLRYQRYASLARAGYLYAP